MRRYVFALAMLTMAGLVPAGVRGDEQEDNEIAQQIGQKLEAEKRAGVLKGFSIKVDVDEATVWMSGHVSSTQQQAKALDVARRIPGVKQVVNDLSVQAPAASKIAAQPISTEIQQTAGTDGGAVGTGVQTAGVAKNVAAKPLVKTAEPIPQAPGQQPVPYGPAYGPGYGQNPYAAGYAPAYAQPVPVYAGTRNQVPLAFAPARPVSHQGEVIDGVPGTPIPMHMPGSGVGIAPARYDHPNMPGYAWPSYAAYPNYAAVTYPKQYSPTAWPYIGPFYPYPQVPLGWRKVTLEWDDGWWMLDFKDRRSMYNH
ncbi:MAG: BON domain-containing protein [Pirellulaceae bacterium]|nr:BON domain-containing protein [Pirellulaceae bacterium]